MQVFRGLLIIIGITIIAGGIAYIGDRVGHQVGRRRLTLFGLRPKYTSTIVAVGTGMIIALSVTLVALAASQYVQTAFFRLGEINDRIHQLQSQADVLQAELGTTRNGQLVLSRGQPLVATFLVIQPSQTDAEQYSALSTFFDETIKTANRTWTRAPFSLRPYPLTANDAEATAKLRRQLTDVRALLADGPVLLLPVADQNLFRGEQIHFAFQLYKDRLAFARGAIVASLDVTGGTSVSNLDINRLLYTASVAATAHDMPDAFVRNPIVANGGQVVAVLDEIAHGRGQFHLVARAAEDIYPHTGALILTIDLGGTHK